MSSSCPLIPADKLLTFAFKGFCDGMFPRFSANTPVPYGVEAVPLVPNYATRSVGTQCVSSGNECMF